MLKILLLYKEKLKTVIIVIFCITIIFLYFKLNSLEKNYNYQKTDISNISRNLDSLLIINDSLYDELNKTHSNLKTLIEKLSTE